MLKIAKKSDSKTQVKSSKFSGGAQKNGSATKSKLPSLVWDEDNFPRDNHARLAEFLAAQEDLFWLATADGEGIVELKPDGSYRILNKPIQLICLLHERCNVNYKKSRKTMSHKISRGDLSEFFGLDLVKAKFRIVDRIQSAPVVLEDFSVTQKGHNAKPGLTRVLQLGEDVSPAPDMTLTHKFLDAMHFAGEADRTNLMAAALTVTLQEHFPGHAPLTLVTGNKSHAGKDTCLDFANGNKFHADVSYSEQDWAMERDVKNVMKANPGASVIVIGNARINRKEREFSCAFLERVLTSKHSSLTKTGEMVLNKYIFAMSTNDSAVNEDLANRALPIHLEFTGDVADRESPIGNPRDEFLPQHRTELLAEQLGMIARWRHAGQPLDLDVKHSFTRWAQTVGGILKFNGFNGFLSNYKERRARLNPQLKALGELVSAMPENGCNIDELLRIAKELGISGSLIPQALSNSKSAETSQLGRTIGNYKDQALSFQDGERTVTGKICSIRKRTCNNQQTKWFPFIVDGDANTGRCSDKLS